MKEYNIYYKENDGLAYRTTDRQLALQECYENDLVYCEELLMEGAL